MRISLLFIASILFSFSVHAEEIEGDDISSMVVTAEEDSLLLPTVSDLEELREESRALYLKGMQELFVELETLQESEGGLYAFGGMGSLICAEPSRVPANASSINCIYAGFMSYRDLSTGYCHRPAQGSCGPSQVQCNPALFGEKVCATVGKRATLSCFERSAARYKNFSDIVKANQQHPEGWNETLDALKQHCETSTQTEVCRLVKKRIARLNRQVVNAEERSPAVSNAKEVVRKEKKTPQKVASSREESKPRRHEPKAKRPETGSDVKPRELVAGEKASKPHGRQESKGWLSAVATRMFRQDADCDVKMLARSIPGIQFEDIRKLVCTTDTIPAVIANKMKAYEQISSFNIAWKGSDEALRYDNLKECLQNRKPSSTTSTVGFTREIEAKTKKSVLVVNDPDGKLKKTYTSDSKMSADAKMIQDMFLQGYHYCRVTAEGALKPTAKSATSTGPQKSGAARSKR